MSQRNPKVRAAAVVAAVIVSFFIITAKTASAQTCTTPPLGMTAWYPGDGNTNDIAGPPFENGTLNGATFAAGKVNQAFSFDGVDDTMTAPAAAAPSGSSARTVDMWLRVNKTAPGNEVLYYGNASLREAFGLDTDGLSPQGNVLLDVFTWGDDINGVDTGVPPGQFMHVAITYDGATTLAIYVNGQVKASKTLGGTLNTTATQVTFGHFFSGYFGGLVDEIEFFNRALTPAEIQAIYAADSAGKCKVKAGQLIISEVSPRGPLGELDEFIEVYNNTDTDHVVSPPDGSAGYGIRVEDHVLRCVIPNGTVIPARGHFLCANLHYSYSSEVPPDAPFDPSAPNFGNIWDVNAQPSVALFSSTVDSSAGAKLDAFGFNTSDPFYREGAGFPFMAPVNTPHSYVRTQYNGYERDTDNNAADFISVNARLDVCCDPHSSLGMPGPQNLASPRVRLGQQLVTLFDPNVGASTAPNRERSAVVVPNGTNGTLRFRRTITNNTAAPVTRMRIRVVDITTLNTPTSAQAGKPTPCTAPCADLRVLSSSDEAAVATSTGPKPTSGTTLDFSTFQPLGGGYNSSLNVNQVSGGTPLAPTTSINVNMLVGIMRGGTARFFFFVEALP